MTDVASWLKKRKVAVLWGGRSSEAEISRRTGQAVLQGFKNLGCRAEGIEAGTGFIRVAFSAAPMPRRRASGG